MGRASHARENLMDAVRELIWTGSYGSTTIDQICEKAAVKKGSFYYFFDSKADLAVAAIDQEWQRRHPELDALFAPPIPPLERLRKYCAYSYDFQKLINDKFGCVLGCPLFTLGAEVSTQQDRLQKKIQEILEYKQKYFETAIRDAHALDLIHAPDAAARARMLFAYYEGLLTQARIRNDLGVLEEMESGTMSLLGVKEPLAVRG